MSSTATITPRPPERWAVRRLVHACGAPTPHGPTKFHWTLAQPPTTVWRPGSLGMYGVVSAAVRAM